MRWKLEIRYATKFSGDHKKEDPNNEESVLSEIKIKIDEMEEPAEENMTKTSDNLKMDELNPAVPDSDEDEEDIDREQWIHWNFT